ncbi:MAG TPA: DUF2231 domain-containing protein [Tepidisphaeraceae bacterium]|jgi:uncharacterized membrane protein
MLLSLHAKEKKVPRDVVVPNLHLILIHFPIALLITGSLIELLAFLWRRSSARVAARWMILLGTVFAVPTVASGFHELFELNQNDQLQESPSAWHDVRAVSPIQGDAWHHLRSHAIVSSAAIGVLLLLCMIYIGGSDTFRRRLHFPFLLVLLASVAALTLSIYRDTPGPESLPRHVATSQPAPHNTLTPLELHLILASLALPIALISLGLSFRAAATSGAELYIESHPSEANYATAFVPHAQVDVDFDRPRIQYQHVPAGRYWLLSALLVILTVLAGIWTLAVVTDTWTPRGLYDMVVQLDAHKRPEPTRRFAHTAASAAVLLLPFILALAARFSPKRGFIAAGFGLLLIIALAAALWTGTLLMLDSPEGPLTSFNGSVPSPATNRAPVELETSEPAAPATAPTTTTRTTSPSTRPATTTIPTTSATQDFNRDL